MIEGLKPYPKYKDSGLLWLGKVPAGWNINRLKNWIVMNECTLPESTPDAFRFRYLDIGSVATGQLAQPPQPMWFAEAPSRARRIVRPGDTIVSTVRTYLRAVYTYPGGLDPLVASTGFAVLTPKGDTEPRFVGYVAQSAHFTDQVMSESIGIAYPAISETALGNLPVVFPLPDEQAAIVRFLDRANGKIERAIRAKKKLIALLNEQKQVIIHRAVTRGLDPDVKRKPSGIPWLGDVPAHWEVAALRHRFDQCLGKMLDAKRITGKYLVPYLRNTDVQWDRINTDDLPQMDIESHELARFTVKPGDLLVCEGGDVGRCAFWRGDLTVCGFQKALHRLRPLRPYRDYPRFQFYLMFLASKLGVFVADGRISTIAHLTGDKLRAHRFVYPPLVEQEDITKYLDAELANLDRAEGFIQREISLLREYRTTLTADVVTGKLDVRQAAKHLPALAEQSPCADDMEDETPDT